MLAQSLRIESSLFFSIHCLRLRIDQAIHTIVVVTIPIFIIGRKTSHASSSTRTSALTFVVSRKRVASSKAPPTLGAEMRSFAGMQLGMSFQVVQSAEPRLAGLTDKWLFLAMGEEMALEVVLASEFGSAIGASMFLCRWRTGAASVVARVGQAQAATRVVKSASGHRVREGLVAILVNLRVFPLAMTVAILRS